MDGRRRAILGRFFCSFRPLLGESDRSVHMHPFFTVNSSPAILYFVHADGFGLPFDFGVGGGRGRGTGHRDGAGKAGEKGVNQTAERTELSAEDERRFMLAMGAAGGQRTGMSIFFPTNVPDPFSFPGQTE